MKINFKKIIIGILILICAIVVYKIPKLLINKNNESLPEVKLKETNDKKSFAIMIQKENGYEEYTSEDDKWPGDDYVFKESKCTDNNGALVNDVITFAGGKATLKTNQTIYCTLYFDKSIIGKLRDNEKLANKNNLSSSLHGGMYRYQGTDDVNNWICFGTTGNCGTNDYLIDKYMYRIIGIKPNGELYLLKETFIKEGNTFGFAWNSKWQISECLGEACEWPNVDIYKRLNGTSDGEIPRSGYNDGANTNIFVDSSEYEYMIQGTEWYNLIADHDWIYGDTNVSDSNTNAYNGDYMYAIETGNKATKRRWPNEEHGQTTCSSISECTEKDYTWSKSVNAKIGLMYMHDVDYAYTGGNPGNRDNIKNSWIHFKKDGYNTSQNYECLIPRFGIGDFAGLGVYSRNVNPIGVQGASWIIGCGGERAVFYLSSKVKIAAGDGTKINPFTLEI